MANYIMSPYLPHASPKKDGSQPSHRAGWALLNSKQLNAPLIHNKDIPDDCTTLYLEPGMEFAGTQKSFNMALSGKMWNGLYLRMKRIADYVDQGGKIVLVDHIIDGDKSVDWGERLYSRKKNYDAQVEKGRADLTFGQLFPNDVEKIKRATLPGTPSYFQKDYKSNKLTFGDSHAISAWLEGSKCSRNDGLTLNGALSRGFDGYIDEMEMSEINTIRFYLGNIDVRHHLCRVHPDRQKRLIETQRLAIKYIHEVLRVKNKYNIKHVGIVELLPIEHECRRLPKTGNYKGQPFWGTAEERMETRQTLNDTLKRLQKEMQGFTIIEWPSEYTHQTETTVSLDSLSGVFKTYPEKEITFKPGMLRFDVMEKPHSVHVAPTYYLWSAV